ncbi:MAG: PQQ-dependent sugar dehydrogenase [Actinomycetota bacterium]
MRLNPGRAPPSPARRRTLPIALLPIAPAAVACSSLGTAATSHPRFTTAPGGTGATTTPAASSSTPAPATTITTAPVPLDDIDPALVGVAAGFPQPVLAAAPPGDDRLFVMEQGGHLQVRRDGRRLGAFLEISGTISFGGQRSLLGQVFHPAYPAVPRFHVDYTDRQSATVVAECRVSAGSDRADPASGRVFLTVARPYHNHNGRLIAFGPDGYPYIGMGDGRGAGDPLLTGRDPTSLPGSILRIAVDGDPYATPPNPWVEDGGAPEVWAKGCATCGPSPSTTTWSMSATSARMPGRKSTSPTSNRGSPTSAGPLWRGATASGKPVATTPGCSSPTWSTPTKTATAR